MKASLPERIADKYSVWAAKVFLLRNKVAAKDRRNLENLKEAGATRAFVTRCLPG
jgi:hypothetical protein